MARLGEIWVALGADNKNLKKGMEDSQDIVKSTIEAISNMKAELASIAAVALPVNEAKSWAAAVNDLTDKTDMAGESASRLLAIGEFFGLTAGDMSDALMKMSKSAFEATVSIDEANAAGKRSEDVYTQFGIAIRDSSGQLLSAEQIFKNVVEVHREMANGLEKTAMEMKIFGRSGAKLNDLLNVTDSEISRVTEAAEKSGLIISTQTSQAWEELQKSLNLSKMELKGIAVTIGNEMMPEVDKMIGGIGDAVNWFSELDSETKKNITTALELAAAISAIRIAGKGLIAVLTPMSKFVTGTLGVAGSIASGIAAAIGLGAIDKADYVKSGGEVMDDDGNTYRMNTSMMDEDQTRKDVMELTKGWQYDSSKSQPQKDYRNPSESNKKGKDDSAKIAKAVSKVSDELGKAKEKTLELGIAYTKMQQDIAYAGLSGGLLVYAGIAKEAAARVQALDDHLKRVKNNVEEAERIRLKAMETGNAEAIRKAQEHLDEELKIQKAAAASIAAEKKIIDKQTQDELLKNSTAKSAMEQQLQTAMREADYGEYLKYLELYKSADAQLFLEKQAALEYQHQWQMESMESQSTKILEMADTFKNGFAQAVGQSIIGATKFGDAIKNLGKQMVAMWVTWMVQRAIAGAFANAQDKKALTEQAAFGKAALAALAPAAAAKLILDPGAAGIAAAAFATLVGGMVTIGSLAGGGKEGSSGLKMDTSKMNKKQLEDYGFLFNPQPLASGGITTGTAIAMIGEGKYDEAVLPLNSRVFKGLFGWLNDGENDKNVNISLVNNGDINTGADYQNILSDFEQAVFAGIRSR